MGAVLGGSSSLSRGLLGFAALLLLGTSWAFASPHGSSADDDYHLTSIWCAHGSSEYCQDVVDGTGALVPRVIAYPACYVNWPASRSAGCTQENSYSLIYTERFDTPNFGYPGPYYWVMGWLAGKDVVSSVQAMRIANVALAAVLLGLALAVTRPVIRRAVALSWGVAIIPVAIFFIASTNPSSWTITGVGLYWAFLLSTLKSLHHRNARFWLSVVGAGASAFIALVARNDSGIYLALSSVAVGLLAWNRSAIPRWVLALVLSLLAAISAFVVFAAYRNWYLSLSLSFPGAQTATDQPNPVVKLLLEIPGFFVGLLGGQRPLNVLSDSGVNQGVDGYRPTGLLYGPGWAEMNLPSIVGIGSLIAVAIVLAVGFNSYRRTRIIAFAALVVATIVQIVIMRAMADFAAFWEVQPRYFVPILLVIVGVGAMNTRVGKALMTRVQALMVMLVVVMSGSVAWMSVAARYAVGPDAAFTNFGQTADWWWETGPSRLVWLCLTIVFTSLWVVATVWNYGTKPRGETQRASVGIGE
jgi:hypothetical protein